MKTSTGFLIAASLAVASGWAQSDNLPQSEATQNSTLNQTQDETALVAVQPKTENGITYLCGGVGLDEAAYMKSEARYHDLMLTFAQRNGEYLADVQVAIKDSKGNPVLETSCGGPIMLVDLPHRGTYRVHAQSGKYSLDRTVHTNAKGHAASVVFAYPMDASSTDGVAEIKPRQNIESTGSSSNAGETGK